MPGFDPDFILQVHRTTHRLGLAIERLGRAHGINQAEGHVLLFLRSHRGNAIVRDVLAAFAHRPSTMTGVLDRLVAKGLVERAASEQDRRSFVLKLTRTGTRAADTLAAGLQAALESVLAGPRVAGAKRVLADVERTLASEPEP